MNIKKAYDLLIDSGLVIVAVISPLAFGSVHVWAYSLIEIISFVLIMVWALRGLFSPLLRVERRLLTIYSLIIIFIVTVYLQTIPLPPDILEHISPKTFKLYASAIPGFNEPPDGGVTEKSLSIYTHATRSALLKILAYFSVFVVITQEVREQRRIKRIATVLIIMGFIESLYGLYGYFSKSPDILGFHAGGFPGRARGTFVNSNHFAGYLGMIIPVGIGYLLALSSRDGRGWYGIRDRIVGIFNKPESPKIALTFIAVISMILGIIFALSRGGVFSLIVAVLFMILLSLISREKRFRNITVVITFTALVVVLWYGISPLLDRFSGVSGSFQHGRSPIWKGVIDMIGDFPLFGTGIGTFEYIYQRFKPERYLNQVVADAHNDYLELISGAGLIGSLPILVGAVYLLVFLITEWRRAKGFGRGVVLGGIGATVYIMLHSLTDFNMKIPGNAMTFTIVAGLTCSALLSGKEMKTAGRRQERRPYLKTLLLRTAMLAVIVLTASSMTASIRQWMTERAYPVERNFTKGKVRAETPDTMSIERLRYAMDLSPDIAIYHQLMGKYYVYGVPKESNDYSGWRRRYELAREEYMKAISLNPSFTDSLSYLARVEFALGRPFEGLRYLNRAVAANPKNFFNHLMYGICIANHLESLPHILKKYYIKRAEEEFRRAVELYPSVAKDTAYLTAMARLSLRKGDKRSAIKLLERTGPLSKRTLTYHLKLARLYLKTGNLRKGRQKFRDLLRFTENEGAGREKMIKVLRNVTDRNPDLIELRLLLAKAYIKDGKTDETVRILRGITAERPDNGEAHYLLGKLYEKKGWLRKAYREYELTLRYSSGHRGASERLLQLYRKIYRKIQK
jgi:O-antigen ligase/tetratricopeptide (TPR) repeat protein